MARSAVIIGNSDGIGYGLTRRLLATGWRVVGLSRRDAGITHPAYTHVIADVIAPGYRDRLRAGTGRPVRVRSWRG